MGLDMTWGTLLERNFCLLLDSVLFYGQYSLYVHLRGHIWEETNYSFKVVPALLTSSRIWAGKI